MHYLLNMNVTESWMTIFWLYYALLGCRIQYLNSYIVHYVGNRQPFEIQPQCGIWGAVGKVKAAVMSFQTPRKRLIPIKGEESPLIFWNLCVITLRCEQRNSEWFDVKSEEHAKSELFTVVVIETRRLKSLMQDMQDLVRLKVTYFFV